MTAGLKVIGGKVGDHGKLGAFISKVKKGSIADTVGHLRPGVLLFLCLNYIKYFNQ